MRSSRTSPRTGRVFRVSWNRLPRRDRAIGLSPLPDVTSKRDLQEVVHEGLGRVGTRQISSALAGRGARRYGAVKVGLEVEPRMQDRVRSHTEANLVAAIPIWAWKRGRTKTCCVQRYGKSDMS